MRYNTESAPRVVKKSKNTNHRIVSVKEIMKSHKLTYQTINHYTDFGLLPIRVKKGNVRFYERKMIEKRLKVIKGLMGEGYSLRLIRKKLIGI